VLEARLDHSPVVIARRHDGALIYDSSSSDSAVTGPNGAGLIRSKRMSSSVSTVTSTDFVLFLAHSDCSLRIPVLEFGPEISCCNFLNQLIAGLNSELSFALS
jgi:hypothetical protein